MTQERNREKSQTCKNVESLKYRSFDSLTLQEIWKLKKLGILNGCGGKGCIIRPPKAIFFEASCDKHDHGYWRGGDEERRRECDDKFFYAMMRDCERLPPSLTFVGYVLWCLLYYYSVRLFGSKYFNYTNKFRMENIIATLKLLGYLIGMLLFTYLDIPQEQLAILGVLMILDFTSGVAKQWRVDPSKLTSKRAWLGVITKSASLSAILTIALIIKGLHLDTSFYLSAMIGLLIMAEGYSILQNIYAVRTGTVLPEYDVVSVILKSISNMLKEKIEKSIDNHR